MRWLEESVMIKVTRSQRRVLASMALMGMSGCLTVNNIPTKDEPALGPDGSIVAPDGGGPGGGGDGAGTGVEVPDATAPRQACEDLPDAEVDGIPLKGVKDYCPGGFACDATRHCVPFEPCSATSAATCSLDELLNEDPRAQTLSYEFSAALDANYLYGTDLGTFGSFDEYKKDGTIFRAKVGTWEREVLYTGLNVPADVTVEGDSLFFRQRAEDPLALYWAPVDGSKPPRLLTTNASYCKVFNGYAFCPQSLGGASCEVARYPLGSSQDTGEFKRPFFTTQCPFLFVGDDDAIYAQSNSGYSRFDPVTGTVTRLELPLVEGETELALWNGQWFGREPRGWLRVRDLDGSNRQRVGGLGVGIQVELTIPELRSVLFTTTLGSDAAASVGPTVVGWIAVLAPADASKGQRLVDLTVVGKNCRVSHVLGASGLGFVLRSEDLGTGRCGGDTNDHYLFRRF